MIREFKVMALWSEVKRPRITGWVVSMNIEVS